MGGFLAGGEKQWRDAQVFSYAAQIEQQIADERAQRRSFLQDIRQARIAQAYNEWAASATDEYVTTSGTAGATGNIFSNFSGAYRYAVDQSNSAAKITTLNALSEKLQKRAAKRDERAATAATYITAAASIAGAAIGGPVGAVVGAGVGNLAVRGMHGGKAAIKASNKQATQSIFTAGTMAAAQYVGTAASGAESAEAAKGVSTAGGTKEFAWDQSTRTGVSTSWVSPNSTAANSSLLSRYRYNLVASLGSNLYRRQY